MIKINKYRCSNGLRLLHHFDEDTQMVALNLLYDVGSKDENPDSTGFAHLFEHLMFGGSVNVPDFDAEVQGAGGENNAWTSNDVTNYYTVVPYVNVETAFRLESDRMSGLLFSQHSLEVQKTVVIEEYKQRNLNQPYGDISKLVREMAYKKHPYRWPVIGKDVAHIENATLDDVKAFFYTHYAPNNCILSVVGKISFDDAVKLTEKWFGPIEQRQIIHRNIPKEPVQVESRFMEVERDVPLNGLVKAYHMCGRKESQYQNFDLLSDILSNGRSSRFFRRLVMEKKIFTSIDASITGDIDTGLFLINARLNPDVDLNCADEAIDNELSDLCRGAISEKEVKKMVHKFETNYLFSNLSYVDKAANMAYYELLSTAEDIDKEVEKYHRITPESLCDAAQSIFKATNTSTLYYKARAPQVSLIQ